MQGEDDDTSNELTDIDANLDADLDSDLDADLEPEADLDDDLELPDRDAWPEPIVRANLVGTAAFVVSATVSATVFTSPVRLVAVIVALALFAVGVFSFLWSYWGAVQRSRTDNIAVAQLYFLVSGSTPRSIRRAMNGLLFAQVVTALVTAIGRNRTDGRAGSTLAFGILVPMFGLGLNGLWCARHGRFATRDARSASVPTSNDEMEQNSRHG